MCCRYFWSTLTPCGCIHGWACCFMHRQPIAVKQYLAQHHYPCDVLQRIIPHLCPPTK
jgi:hypothetical protein